jgi:hypothetical protein
MAAPVNTPYRARVRIRPRRCVRRRAHLIPADRSGNRWPMGAGQWAGEPVLTVPAWRRGWRTMAQDLAKSSSRTRRKQRRALRVDRFGSERTQRNEVLSRKTGRQAKFCRTSDQNFLDAPRATKFIVLQGIMQQILAFPPSRLVGADLEAVTAGLHGKSNAMAQRPAPAPKPHRRLASI